VDALKALGAPEVTQPKVSLRPWGSWSNLLGGEGFKLKLIEVNPGARLSLQRHAHRSEHWVVIEGTATVVRGDDVFDLATNESTFIPLGEVHRLENRTAAALRLIEVQLGDYVGEDDVERLEDDWDRES
jgi:mannose-6-phosphate isomerase-like protein (cupin superfamily)